MKFSPIALIILLIAVLPLAHAQSADEAQAEPGYAKLTTSKGDIYLRLRADKAPLSVENFVSYVQDGFYDGTIFHRVVSDFVIQGGGYTADLKEKPTEDPIRNEADNMLPNKRGAVAMARTMSPHSATAQFFINVQDNMALDHAGKYSSNAWGYAVFAEVVRGMDVVDQIRIVPVGPAAPLPSHVPAEPIVIESVALLLELPSEEAEAETAETPAEVTEAATDA